MPTDEKRGSEMTAPALTYPQLRALRPCSESLTRVAKLMGGANAWDGKKITAARARKAGATFGDIAWAASALAREDTDVERRLRLWMADCAAHVLHIYEQDYPADDRPREAIIASRAFARGETMAAAWDAALATAWDAASAAASAAAWAAAWDATRDATRDAAWDATRDAEQSWQFDRLIEWLSAKEPTDWPLPKKQPVKKAA